MKISCEKFGIRFIELPSIDFLRGTKLELNKYAAEGFRKYIENNELSVSISDNDDCNDDFVIATIK
jgi:adenine specific DNA methylase Mod